jgi:GNAT superfamily N-acetyltransferase
LKDDICAHYNAPALVAREVVRAHLLGNLLAPDSPLRLVVASGTNGRVIGFAAIALLYSLVDPTPEKRRQCLVKELFVRSSERSRGVGRALMAWVARHALENGCCRIDWPVNAANRAGIVFYERLGAEHVVERLSYRLSGAQLARVAGASGDSISVPQTK